MADYSRRKGNCEGRLRPALLSVCPIVAEADEITDLPRLHSNPSRTATIRSGATERAEAQRPQIYDLRDIRALDANWCKERTRLSP